MGGDVTNTETAGFSGKHICELLYQKKELSKSRFRIDVQIIGGSRLAENDVKQSF